MQKLYLKRSKPLLFNQMSVKDLKIIVMLKTIFLSSKKNPKTVSFCKIENCFKVNPTLIVFSVDIFAMQKVNLQQTVKKNIFPHVHLLITGSFIFSVFSKYMNIVIT